MKYYAKNNNVEAIRWFKNGDHPEDYSKSTWGYENDKLREFTGAEHKANGWEGLVVRYFRHPGIAGTGICVICKTNTYHDHGWIDDGGPGKIVCPGNWVITNKDGSYTVMNNTEFNKQYELHDPGKVLEACFNVDFGSLFRK